MAVERISTHHVYIHIYIISYTHTHTCRHYFHHHFIFSFVGLPYSLPQSFSNAENMRHDNDRVKRDERWEREEWDETWEMRSARQERRKERWDREMKRWYEDEREERRRERDGREETEEKGSSSSKWSPESLQSSTPSTRPSTSSSSCPSFPSSSTSFSRPGQACPGQGQARPARSQPWSFIRWDIYIREVRRFMSSELFFSEHAMWDMSILSEWWLLNIFHYIFVFAAADKSIYDYIVIFFGEARGCWALCHTIDYHWFIIYRETWAGMRRHAFFESPPWSYRDIYAWAPLHTDD